MKNIFYLPLVIIALIAIVGFVKFNLIGGDVYVPNGAGGYVNDSGEKLTIGDDDGVPISDAPEDKEFEDKLTKVIKGDDGEKIRLIDTEDNGDLIELESKKQSHSPVCVQVNTGIRCVKSPCPSDKTQTYSSVEAAKLHDGFLKVLYNGRCNKMATERINDLCDEDGKRYKTPEDAKVAGLSKAEYGATFCPEYKMDSSWDKNNDGINDCYDDNSCSKDLRYMDLR